MNASGIGAAIVRAAGGNPLLDIGTGASADPVAAGLCTGAGMPALVDAVGAWLGTAERRVAASAVVLGYAARLVGPTLAVMLREGVLLDVAPSAVRYSFDPERGFRLTLACPAGSAGPPRTLSRRWCHEVVDGHLRPLVGAVTAGVPVAARLLWGNVASGVTGALRTLAESGAVGVDTAHATGRELLDHGPLRGTGQLTVHNGQLRFVRRSCCLFYRLNGAGMCGDCVLLPANR